MKPLRHIERCVLLQVPNAKMMADEVTNVTRSGNHRDRLVMHLDISTPDTVLHDVHEAVCAIVHEHPVYFSGLVYMYTQAISDPLKLEVSSHP